MSTWFQNFEHWCQFQELPAPTMTDFESAIKEDAYDCYALLNEFNSAKDHLAELKKSVNLLFEELEYPASFAGESELTDALAYLKDGLDAKYEAFKNKYGPSVDEYLLATAPE